MTTTTTLSALQKRHSKMQQLVVSENVQFGVLVDADSSSHGHEHDQASVSAGFKLISKGVRLDVRQNETRISIAASHAGGSLLRIAIWNKADLEFSRAGSRSLVIQMPEPDQPLGEAGGDASERGSFLVRFDCESDARSVYHALTSARDGTNGASKFSVFERRTEASSAEQYFQFYSLLSQQQNMLQDYVRTSTYQRAILDNEIDFRDKVVMDVGAGSGILSFFAVQAGARRVYAVEASSTAQHCEALVNANQLAGRIVVVRGKLEEIELDEPVDVLVSEPLGYMLFNERMLETFLHAKKFLRTSEKPRTNSVGSTYSDADDVHPFSVGRMFPTRSELFIAPFTDDALFSEVQTKANFWYQQSFHGCVDLTALRDAAQREYFRQPVVDTFDVRVCCAPPQKHTVDFATATETDLTRIDVPLSFVASQSATVHGLAFWFDVAFVGSAATVWLSTSPTEPLTHWYQVRCLVPTPIFVHAGQTLTGRLLLCANARQSYDVDIELVATLNLHANNAPGAAFDTVHTIRSRNTLDLKNPLFRYTGVPAQPPPGTHTQQTNPTELYWQSAQNTSVQYDAVNGAVAFPIGVQTVAALPNGSGISQAATVATCDTLSDPGDHGALHQTQSRPGTAVQQFTV